MKVCTQVGKLNHENVVRREKNLQYNFKIWGYVT